jgi:hypothetical protein
METNNATCWVVADPGWGSAVVAAQFAALRGARVRVCAQADSLPQEVLAGKGTVIAMTAAALRRCDWRLLKRCVEAGATVHVSRFEQALEHSLQPFVDGRFRIESRTDIRSFRLCDAATLPQALRGEELPAGGAAAVAVGLNGHCRTLMAAEQGGSRAPALFRLECGAGAVIYDPNSGADETGNPIVERLATPRGILAGTGALVAANLANQRRWQAPTSFNITIDDRPANFDYLGPFRLKALLEHFNAHYPGVHLDLAWTPEHVHVSRRYVDLVRRCGGGFVWHGFHRHVDHRTLADPANELRRGQALVEEIARRFRVQFQKVMVFPYERTSWDLLARLEKAGFIAVTECAAARPEAELGVPPFMRRSIPTHFVPGLGIPVLRRYPVAALNRSTLLALAALGHPIIAMAHPLDLALRRFALGQGPGRALGHFERLLEFASHKGLRPASLEEIASGLPQA